MRSATPAEWWEKVEGEASGKNSSVKEDISRRPIRRMAAEREERKGTKEGQRFRFRSFSSSFSSLPPQSKKQEEVDDDRLTLSVPTHSKSIDEPSSESDDVLERSREGNSRHVLDAVNPEHGSVEDGVPGGSVGLGRGTDGGFAELGVGDLESDVGSSCKNATKRNEENEKSVPSFSLSSFSLSLLLEKQRASARGERKQEMRDER